MAFGAEHFVPILKSKQGELGALQQLDPGSRARTTPLLEVRFAEPEGIAFSLLTACGELPFFVHAVNVDGVESQPWSDFVQELFSRLRDVGAAAIPVVTPDDEAEILARVADITSTDGRGACIRADAEDVALSTIEALGQELERIRAPLSLQAGDVDLLIDVGTVRDSLVARVTTAEAALRLVPDPGEWRTLTTAFSSFPERLGEVVGHGVVVPLPRADAQAYALLRERAHVRTPTYADYGLGVPFYGDTPFLPVPNIRYTVEGSWMVHRGQSRADRNTQYVNLARQLAGAEYFDGAAFSYGDEYVEQVASGHGGPGNPMTWLRAATNRHLVYVSTRLGEGNDP